MRCCLLLLLLDIMFNSVFVLCASPLQSMWLCVKGIRILGDYWSVSRFSIHFLLFFSHFFSLWYFNIIEINRCEYFGIANYQRIRYALFMSCNNVRHRSNRPNSLTHHYYGTRVWLRLAERDVWSKVQKSVLQTSQAHTN